MTKTKDEIVAEIGNGEHVINYSTPIMPSDVRRAYSLGVELGASKMYDYRQKEIDEVNRWWAERWLELRMICTPDDYLKRAFELDAAAAWFRPKRGKRLKDLVE